MKAKVGDKVFGVAGLEGTITKICGNTASILNFDKSGSFSLNLEQPGIRIEAITDEESERFIKKQDAITFLIKNGYGLRQKRCQDKKLIDEAIAIVSDEYDIETPEVVEKRNSEFAARQLR